MVEERPTVQLLQPGPLPYHVAWDLQRARAAARSAGDGPDTLLLTQHPHTYTITRRTRPEHLRMPPDTRDALGVAVVAVDRGGDITYHGPGQVVCYPILKLSQHGGDVGRYLRMLEEVAIVTLAAYGVAAGRLPGLTGVWVGDAKICAIGVKLSASGVTTHGLALNIAPDLHFFDQIVPCGIADRGVTSLARLLGAAPPHDEAERQVALAFAEVFGVTLADTHALAATTPGS